MVQCLVVCNRPKAHIVRWVREGKKKARDTPDVRRYTDTLWYPITFVVLVRITRVHNARNRWVIAMNLLDDGLDVGERLSVRKPGQSICADSIYDLRCGAGLHLWVTRKK